MNQKKLLSQTKPSLIGKALLPLIVSIAPLNAAVLISDNFNTPDGTLGANTDLATRQTGSLKGGTGLEWVVPRKDPLIEGNKVRADMRFSATSTSGRFYFDHDFTDTSIITAGGFTVEYDFIPGASSTSWTALGLGATTALLGGNELNLAKFYDFGFFLRNNGDFFIYKDQGGASGGVFEAIPSIVEGASYRVSLEVLTSDFNSGTSAAVSVKIDGTTIDLNGGAAGTDSTFTWDADGTNYIALETNHTTSHFDNVSIATIPEPQTSLLAAAAGLMLLTRRGKRSKASA